MRLAGGDKHVLANIASVIDHQFDHEQRKLLFKWLTQIMETVKWEGIFVGNEVNFFPLYDFAKWRVHEIKQA